MCEPLRIRSRLRDYTVSFVDDIRDTLTQSIDDGDILIADANVYEHHRDELSGLVPDRSRLLLQPSEATKTLEGCRELIEWLVEAGVRRGQRLVALGGGVIQDLTSFTASVLYRGIDWRFVPTTLLSQADSCIGGKTSINVGDKKNLVGGFYPPSEVVICTKFLDSLGRDQLRSGIGEILHFYMYANSPKLEPLIHRYTDLMVQRPLLLEHIYESLTIKRRVVEADEFDRTERQKLNYGHTFGHAVESATAYYVNHGQAVTIGMDLANRVSAWLGIMDQDQYERLHGVLAVNFPVYDWATIDVQRYMRLLACDKKNRVEGSVTCILAEGPGNLAKYDVPLDDGLHEVIVRYLAQASC